MTREAAAQTEGDTSGNQHLATHEDERRGVRGWDKVQELSAALADRIKKKKEVGIKANKSGITEHGCSFSSNSAGFSLAEQEEVSQNCLISSYDRRQNLFYQWETLFCFFSPVLCDQRSPHRGGIMGRTLNTRLFIIMWCQAWSVRESCYQGSFLNSAAVICLTSFRSLSVGTDASKTEPGFSPRVRPPSLHSAPWIDKQDY